MSASSAMPLVIVNRHAAAPAPSPAHPKVAAPPAAPVIRQAAIAARWTAAFERAQAPSSNAESPFPSREIASRWRAAFKRAGIG